MRFFHKLTLPELRQRLEGVMRRRSWTRRFLKDLWWSVCDQEVLAAARVQFADGYELVYDEQKKVTETDGK